jgi:hypothetical protein
MSFRLRALGLHLLASAITLALVVGTLYVGWYRWPGWYLADVLQVAAVLVGVDRGAVALGPGEPLVCCGLWIGELSRPILGLLR